MMNRSQFLVLKMGHFFLIALFASCGNGEINNRRDLEELGDSAKGGLSQINDTTASQKSKKEAVNAKDAEGRKQGKWTRYEDGKLIWECNYLNDSLDGAEITFKTNGDTFLYKYSKVNDPYVYDRRYDDVTGKLVMQTIKTKDGRWVWLGKYRDGALGYEEKYDKNGKIVSTKDYELPKK